MQYVLSLAALAVAACTHSPQQTLLRDARRLAECMARSDSTCVVRLSSIESYQRISPPHTDFSAAQSRFFSKLTRAQARYTRFEVGPPAAIYQHGSARYAFVPYTAALQLPGKPPWTTTAYFVAQSDDGGKSWRFFDGAHVTPENIRTIIPAYRAEPLPPVTSQ